MLRAKDFFDLSGFEHRCLFDGCERVWDGLARLTSYLAGTDRLLPVHPALLDGVPLPCHLILHEGEVRTGDGCEIRFGAVSKGGLEVFCDGVRLAGASVLMAGSIFQGRRIGIGSGVLVETGALVREPTLIGDHSEVRQGAYLRGYGLIGSRCVVGHTTEVKHSVFLNDAKAGHFAYVGDSILGGEVNLGAGTKLANFRFLPGNVRVRIDNGFVDSGLRKFGAILGDRVQTGCNTVTSPGAVLGPEGLVMPNTTVASGVHPPRSVLR